jgi:hypothetical protein
MVIEPSLNDIPQETASDAEGSCRLPVGASDLGRLLFYRELRPMSTPASHPARDLHNHDENGSLLNAFVNSNVADTHRFNRVANLI